MNRLLLFSLLALPICANTINSPYELSSPGGSYSLGSGQTYTQFTINPFDIILSQGEMISYAVGTATLPESEIDNPTLTGAIDYSFGNLDLPGNLWTMADPWNAPSGELQWGIQNDVGGWQLDAQDYGPDEAMLWLGFPSVIALDGSTVQLTMRVGGDGNTPEPARLWLVLAGLGCYWKLIPEPLSPRSSRTR